MHVHKTAGGGLSDTSNALASFSSFCIDNTPNAGFLETISGYEVFQRKIGETNVEHPPLFTKDYHASGLHDANYNGSPIGAALPKDVCVFVKLGTSGGRSGKMFVRNLLEESDVDSAVSGTWEFSSGSTRFTVARFNTVVSNTLSPNLPAGSDFANEQFVVAHLLLVKSGDTRSAYATNVSSVTALRPVWNRAHR
jgi:hypothetical protein